MKYYSLIRDLRRSYPEITLLEEEPLSAHCSFRIGGPCDLMIFPSSVPEIDTICRLLRSGGERPFIMGNGTDLLFGDGPLHRVVLRLGENFSDNVPDEDRLTAQAGITLSKLAVRAASLGLSGMEFAHGIPGTLGGAVSMNAGAYGGEMKDIVESVAYLDGDLVLRETGDPALSYRHSRFSDTEDVILSARVRLVPGEEEAIRCRMRELMDRRRSSQPLDMPSAGSTFKRPTGGYAAALIDQAGLKGFAVGGAQVSEKHAGFVVNRGGATCEDVLRLMEHIQRTVLKTSGIALEPEVKIIRE